MTTFSVCRGNDTIKTKDGNKDYINCGAGANDTAYVDRSLDSWVNCRRRAWRCYPSSFSKGAV